MRKAFIFSFVLWMAICVFDIVLNIVRGNFVAACGFLLAAMWSAEVFWLMLRRRPETVYKLVCVWPRWIPVEERMPGEEVAAYRKEHDEDPEFLVMIKGAKHPTSLLCDGNHWYDYDGNEYAVTHWKPMPAPPKAEASGV